MAVILGFIPVSKHAVTQSPLLSVDLWTLEQAPVTAGQGPVPAIDISPYTNNLPVSADAAAAILGFLVNSYSGDFYNRIHYSAVAFDLGNVITATTRQVLVWNAYLGPKTLSGIVYSNAEGVVMDGPLVPPVSVPGLAETTYTITIYTEGPPIIEALLTFNWVGANNGGVAITGSRITAWVWRPNWARGIIERLSWLTDVIRGYDGTEQRIRARRTPRRGVEFEYLVDGYARRKFEVALWDWQARTWALPIWPDGQQLTAPITAGDTVITAATDNTDYRVGGLAIVMDIETGDHEVAEIDAITVGTITAKRPTERSWPAGRWIFPARPARLADKHKLGRFTGDHASGIAAFTFTDTSEWPPAAETDTYRGYPVFSSLSNARLEHAEEYQRRLQTIDNGVGKWSVDDTTGMAETVVGHLWSATSRAEIAALRAWLYARQGRLTMFWRPTGIVDLVAVQTISDLALSIDIEWIGYTKYIQADKNRRDIRIELHDGTTFHRRITSSVELDATTERIGIDAMLGVVVTPAQIARISFMVLRRLDSDNIELAWWTGEVVDCQFPMRSINNDV